MDKSNNFNNTYDFFGSMDEAFTAKRCYGTAHMLCLSEISGLVKKRLHIGFDGD